MGWAVWVVGIAVLIWLVFYVRYSIKKRAEWEATYPPTTYRQQRRARARKEAKQRRKEE